MSEPLKIRFATDVSSAKAGLTDLAASVVTNVGLVSAALNKGARRKGATARRSPRSPARWATITPR